MCFHFKAVYYAPRKEMYISEALSRMQSENRNRMATVPEEEMNIYVDSLLDSLPVSHVKLMEIKEAQDEDPVCRQIKSYCLEGWPDKFRRNDALKPYWSARGALTPAHGILQKTKRVIMPSAKKLQVLDKIHEGHQGIVKCRKRVKTSVWWPGLSREVQDMVENCNVCAKHQQQRAEPLMPTAAWPSGQRVGLAIRRSQVRVPLWPLAGFVLGRPEFKFSATLVNSQLVAFCQLGFLILLCCI